MFLWRGFASVKDYYLKHKRIMLISMDALDEIKYGECVLLKDLEKELHTEYRSHFYTTSDNFQIIDLNELLHGIVANGS